MALRIKTKPKAPPWLPQPWRFFLWEAALFALTLLLGILAGVRFKQLLNIRGLALTSISIWQFFLSFAAGTLVLLAFVYFFRFKRAKKAFFKIILWGTLVLGNLFFWSLWIPNDWLILLLIAILIFLLVKKPIVAVHNAALILAMAGVGAGLGVQLDPLLVCFMMLIFALYDFVAVYITKHMIRLAQEMVNQQAIVGLVIPRTTQEFKKPISAIKEEGRFMILGGGDVMFPLLLCVACLRIGWPSTVLVSFFSLLGLLVVFLIFIAQKTRRPLPALPPIALLAVSGYFLSQLLW